MRITYRNTWLINGKPALLSEVVEAWAAKKIEREIELLLKEVM